MSGTCLILGASILSWPGSLGTIFHTASIASEALLLQRRYFQIEPVTCLYDAASMVPTHCAFTRVAQQGR